MTNTKVLNVVVVGAGIAGLAAALGLRCAGHDVTIYERSMTKDEVGAAITLTPNAHAVLSKWGFKPSDAAGNDMTKARFLHPETLELVVTRDFGDLKEEYGNNQVSYPRVDLHRRLRTMAQDAGVRIELDVGVIDVNCETGRLILQSGTTVDSDLVVIADGIRASRYRLLDCAVSTNLLSEPLHNTNHRSQHSASTDWILIISHAHSHLTDPRRPRSLANLRRTRQRRLLPDQPTRERSELDDLPLPQ